MLKRMSMSSSKEENYEHVLMCLICRSLFDDNDHQPKFLPCHHTFCKDCLREYVRQVGEEIECPSCRKMAMIPTAGVAALQTNFYVKYIHNLVQGVYIGDGKALECGHHPAQPLKYYCKDCCKSICEQCCLATPDKARCCGNHKKVTLTAVTEEYHQRLDTGFAKSHAIIEHKKVELEAMLKALSDEKDQALLKIESTYEQHTHTLNRRTTLLKNKVIAIYNEHVDKLEADLEEISTAMTCIVSLKEFHETFLAKGDFHEIDRGIVEMEEVQDNIRDKIQPRENHIIYEEKHGIDKFRGCVKDLGRVRCSRPTIPRSEPEGNDALATHISPTTPGRTDSDSGSPIASSSSSSLAYAEPIPAAIGLQATAGVGASGTTSNVTASSEEVKSIVSSSRNNDPMTASFHAQMGSLGGDALLLKSSGDSAVDKRVGSGCGHATKGCDAAVNSSSSSCLAQSQSQQSAAAAPAAATTAGSDKPVMVVRPKTLKTNNILTPRKPDKTNTSKAAKVKPLAMVSQLIKNGPSKTKAAADNDEVFETTDGPVRNQAAGPSSTEKDANANTREFPAASIPTLVKNPKEEILKQTDKMYHHLVYTSYDEEELLRELQAGKVQVDGTPAAVVASSSRAQSVNGAPRRMDDSDSWMTVSSDGDSTISGNSDEEVAATAAAVSREISQL